MTSKFSPCILLTYRKSEQIVLQLMYTILVVCHLLPAHEMHDRDLLFLIWHMCTAPISRWVNEVALQSPCYNIYQEWQKQRLTNCMRLLTGHRAARNSLVRYVSPHSPHSYASVLTRSWTDVSHLQVLKKLWQASMASSQWDSTKNSSSNTNTKLSFSSGSKIPPSQRKMVSPLGSSAMPHYWNMRK